MRKFRRLLIASSIGLAWITPVSAASFNSGARTAPQDVLEQAQYGGHRGSRRARCANWQQQCANLYGWNTPRWQACMGQPQAVADCSGGRGGYDDDYGSGGPGACANWQQQCANLYGWQTQRWHACMGQRQAVRACR